ncbi:MAG: NAD-dependent protein deacetylase [Burkholderiaceae bacterium]
MASATALQAFIDAHPRLFVLTGAGCSTGSGIPDYRDTAGHWKRPQPMTYQAFTDSEAARRRYWARSLVGWPVIRNARPNSAHHALNTLEATGRISLLVTQNVDGLHQKAGAQNVVDLHGRIDAVICLQCRERSERDSFQQILSEMNPNWATRQVEVAPDGDADIDETDFSDFLLPACTHCNGILKPDVVFFGESVPRDRVQAATTALESSDALLIVGSSLMVFSGFRFARHAAQLGLPIASVTRGVGRADDLLTLKIDSACDEVLPAVTGMTA